MVATKKTTKKKASPKAKAPKPPRFPHRELKSWLKGRTEWNHQEWLGLLDDLREQGFGYYADSKEQQDLIGQYLEENRK